jgi:hypothetical protein
MIVDSEIGQWKLTGVAVGNTAWAINAFLKLVALCLKKISDIASS